uniref:Uncharacterized protein n=1 Tax=Arundo donax TaxID=35708 RepID=A0A0A8Z041_ARUDO
MMYGVWCKCTLSTLKKTRRRSGQKISHGWCSGIKTCLRNLRVYHQLEFVITPYHFCLGLNLSESGPTYIILLIKMKLKHK